MSNSPDWRNWMQSLLPAERMSMFGTNSSSTICQALSSCSGLMAASEALPSSEFTRLGSSAIRA